MTTATPTRAEVEALARKIFGFAEGSYERGHLSRAECQMLIEASKMLRVYAVAPHCTEAPVANALFLAAQKAAPHGRVPDRETFWLVERINVSPPQYISLSSAGWHSDVWRARRFGTEREAHDYWRAMGEIDRMQFRVIEHMFINKEASQAAPVAEGKPTEEMRKTAQRLWQEFVELSQHEVRSYQEAPFIDLIADALAAVAHKAALEADARQWRPIETAPKDGTEMLVACTNGEIFLVQWMLSEHFEDGRFVFKELDLTHWMPLPEPPAAFLPERREP